MKLRELREKKLLSQRELAEETGVRTETICRLEKGKNKPRSSTRSKLAKALGVEPEAIDF
jgi:transcriptional regulator with XRE-family HTH domain